MNFMYKKIIVLIILFFSAINLCSEDKVFIGVPPPFMNNKEVNTFFINKQFVFELLSNYTSEKYFFEILNIENIDVENKYISNCKNEVRKNNEDYLLYTNVYSINSNLYIKLLLINPYNNEIIFSKYFQKIIELNINETLFEIIKESIVTIDSMKLIKQKKTIEKKKKEVVEKKYFRELNKEYKNEVFIQNGFLKNAPLIMTFFSWYVGYNFTPFKFFSLECCIFWGSGFQETGFSFKNNIFDNFFIGTYNAVYLFIPGIITPTFGLRFEVSYLINKDISFQLPIDIGFKLYINQSNAIKISSSFQFAYFSLNNISWNKSFTIGVMVGYARKF